jgi:hypothetical protein
MTNLHSSQLVTGWATIITARLSLAPFLISLLFIFIPHEALADSCASSGYTVEYINGVSDTLQEAKLNQQSLKFLLGSQYKGQPLDVKLAYNEDHVGGAGSVAELVSQMLLSPISDYDLHTVLRQISVDDTTRKLVLVGHSQGALYANSIYDYAIANGEPPRSVDLYAVATPASYVAGGGKYITSGEDATIYSVRVLAQTLGLPAPLPANVSIQGSQALADLPATHFFSTYIDGAGDKIIKDIDSQFDELQSQPFSGSANCFVPPKESAADLLQRGVFAIADPAANKVRDDVEMAYQGTVAVAGAAAGLVQLSYEALASAAQFVSGPKANPMASQNTEKNFIVTKKLYGSSIDTDEYKELNNQGGAAITAFAPEPQQPVQEATSGNATTMPEIIEIAATSTPATTTAPVLFFGGSALPSPPIVASVATDTPVTTVQNQNQVIGTTTASTTNQTFTTQGSSTPPLPPVFITTSPVLSIPVCSFSSNPIACVIATTTVKLVWTDVPGSVSYGVRTNSIQTATTTATSTTVVLQDQTTSTFGVVAYGQQGVTATSSDLSVTVQLPVTVPPSPPTPAPVTFVSDTFDAFNSEGWQTFDTNGKNFDFDDDNDGSCFHGGCVVGILATSTFVNNIPRMSVELSSGLAAGAFSVYAKAQRTMGGSSGPSAVLSVCAAGTNNCNSQGGLSIPDISLFGQVPLDGAWHQYYVAWRQGSAHVESCVMRDNVTVSNCTWNDTGLALGTTFDGVALWATGGYRNEQGANLWFDELQAQ